MPTYEIAHWRETYDASDKEVEIDPYVQVQASSYGEALEIMRNQYLPQTLDSIKMRILSKASRQTDQGEVDIYYYPGTSPFAESFGLIYCYAPILRENN